MARSTPEVTLQVLVFVMKYGKPVEANSRAICDRWQVLLGLKTKKIGAGYLNGCGGNVEVGESLPEAAIRELLEEAGLKAKKEDLEPVGGIEFRFKRKRSFVALFRLRHFQGQPKESDEMTDFNWYSADKPPVEVMLPGDRLFVPQILQGRKIRSGYIALTDKYKVAQSEIEWDE